MKWYNYTVKTERGETLQMGMWAESTEEVYQKASRAYPYVLAIEEQKKKMLVHWTPKKVIQFSYQLSLLLEAGLPLSKILKLPKGEDALLYEHLQEGIQRGSMLSSVLRDINFPLLGVVLIQAGEVSGTLAESFRLISTHFEQERKWKQMIQSALAYPMFLLILLILFLLGAVVFILPKFKLVFASLNIELPWLTRCVLGSGDMVLHYGGLISLGLMVVLLSAYMWYNAGTHRLLVAAYVWKYMAAQEWLGCFYYARMMRVWSLLLDTGLSIVETLTLTKSLWRNAYATQCQEEVVQLLRGGTSLSRGLRDTQLGTPLMYELILAGEESGELVAMLAHLSTYYTAQMERFIARLQQLLEPLVLSFMGVGVGVLVISVMLPLFKAISSLGSI